MAELLAKGTNFFSVLGAIDELRGESFRKAIVARLGPEPRHALEFGSLIASGWYPIGWYRELMDAAVDAQADASFARAIGRLSLRRELNGVHRVLMKTLSVETLQRQGGRFFQAYFKGATVGTESLGPRLARSYYANCVGFNRHLWQEQLGCIEELLAHSRVKAPRVRVVSGGEDADHAMEIEVTWR
jgi:hypothetical protein